MLCEGTLEKRKRKVKEWKLRKRRNILQHFARIAVGNYEYIDLSLNKDLVRPTQFLYTVIQCTRRCETV